MRRMKRRMLCLLLTLCCLWGGGALAAPELRVRQGGDGFAVLALGGESVRWWDSQKNGWYYLFLPAAADASALEVYSDLPDAEIQVGNDVVIPGVAVDAFVPGWDVSVRIGGSAYKVRVMQSANIPAMFIHTENGTLEAIHADKAHKETGAMRLVDADGMVEYDGALRQLKARGNATFQYPKKSYQIKLEDKTDLLGMGKARTWILLAGYSDYSLLRNRLTFDLAWAAGLAYTPEGQHVDLYIDGDYRGSYLLCEKVEVDEARVDVFDLEKATEEANDQPLPEYRSYGTKKSKENTEKGFHIPNDPPDITGGYLLELDYPMRYGPEASGFVTRRASLWSSSPRNSPPRRRWAISERCSRDWRARCGRTTASTRRAAGTIPRSSMWTPWCASTWWRRSSKTTTPTRAACSSTSRRTR